MPSENLEEFKEFYKLHPKTEKGTSNELYYDECPRVNRQTIKSWIFRLQRQVQLVETKKEIIPKSNQKHSSQPPQVIDDPDELLMSVAIRELNRANPDPRWASILISCKKENISNKSEVLDKFNQLPTQALVNLLSKSLQEEH